MEKRKKKNNGVDLIRSEKEILLLSSFALIGKQYVEINAVALKAVV